MKFTKMQGCGNDYVYINGFVEKIEAEEKPDFVRRMSNRNFGVGSDGVIFINPSEEADFEMEMFNADGTRSEMCGNGIRCVAKYVYDHGMTEKTKGLPIISGGHVKYLDLFPGEDGKIERVRVNMGAPILSPKEIPTTFDGEKVIDRALTVCGETYKVTCVSMGNPHAIVFVEDTMAVDIEKIGPHFENHEVFPRRTNTEFVQVVNRGYVKMRVWERGTGETLACGTGCCATAMACILNGLTDDHVDVEVLGGLITIDYDRENNLVFMTGPAVTVFEGEM